VDFSSIIRSLRKAKYAGWVIVELDRFEAPPGGPDEAARSNKQALQVLGFKTGQAGSALAHQTCARTLRTRA